LRTSYTSSSFVICHIFFSFIQNQVREARKNLYFRDQRNDQEETVSPAKQIYDALYSHSLIIRQFQEQIIKIRSRMGMHGRCIGHVDDSFDPPSKQLIPLSSMIHKSKQETKEDMAIELAALKIQKERRKDEISVEELMSGISRV